MKPLILLLIVFGVTAFISRLSGDGWNVVFGGNLAMCLMLCLTALGHFKFMKGMSRMLPEFVPYKKELVILTGVLEIVLGACLLFPLTRHAGGMALLAFLILVLPANINAAVHRIDYEKGTPDGHGPRYLWFRVPLQLFFIGWVYYFSVK